MKNIHTPNSCNHLHNKAYLQKLTHKNTNIMQTEHENHTAPTPKKFRIHTHTKKVRKLQMHTRLIYLKSISIYHPKKTIPGKKIHKIL